MDVEMKVEPQEQDMYTSNILEGTVNIAKAYDELFRQGDQLGGRGSLAKYTLEVGAVFSAAQLLGYYAGSGQGPQINLNQVPISCVRGEAQKMEDYPGLKIILAAQQNPRFAAAFQDATLADLNTIRDQISSYFCNIKVASTPAGKQNAQLAFEGINDAATCGYQLGLMGGQGASVCYQGGKKKKRGGRRKNMRGGDLENIQLNLLTTAVILGAGYGLFKAGAFGVLLTGLDFCYRQGRSILYTMNWLKRPCTSDASIISGILFKSIPGIGQASTTCLEIAQRNKIMNTALITIVGSVYSAAIALGMRVITQQDLTSMPGAVFRLVKEHVSRRILTILKYVGSRSYEGTIASFNAVARGVGGADEIARQMAATIVTALKAPSCPEDSSQQNATAAAAVVTANDAVVAIGGAPVPNGITPEQQEALNSILGNMSQENKTAFVQAVRLATQMRVTIRRKYDDMKAAGNQAAEAASGNQAAKQAAGAAAFIAAFIAEGDAEAKKQIYALMDDEHKDFIKQSGQVDMSTLQGGRRKRKTRRHKNKKKKAKTMRKKKTRGRKGKHNAKRKTKGKKSKGRRKTRNYRR